MSSVATEQQHRNPCPVTEMEEKEPEREVGLESNLVRDPRRENLEEERMRK